MMPNGTNPEGNEPNDPNQRINDPLQTFTVNVAAGSSTTHPVPTLVSDSAASDASASTGRREESGATSQGESLNTQGIDSHATQLPEVPDLRDAPPEVRDQVADASSNVSATADAVGDLDRRVEDVPANIVALVNQAVESTNQQWETRIATMQGAIDSLRAENEQLQTQVASERGDRETLATQVQDLASERTELQDALRAGEAQQQTLREQAQQRETDWQNTVNTLQTQNQNLQGRFQALEQRFTDQGTENGRLQTEVQALRDRLSDGQQELARLDDTRRAENRASLNQIRQLHQQAQDLRDTVDALRQQLARQTPQPPPPVPATPNPPPVPPAGPNPGPIEQGLIVDGHLNRIAPWLAKTPAEFRGIFGSGWVPFMHGWLSLPDAFADFAAEHSKETAVLPAQRRAQALKSFEGCERSPSRFNKESRFISGLCAQVGAVGFGATCLSYIMSSNLLTPNVMGFFTCAVALMGIGLSGKVKDWSNSQSETKLTKLIDEAHALARSGNYGKSCIKFGELYCLTEKWKLRSVLFPQLTNLTPKGVFGRCAYHLSGVVATPLAAVAGVVGLTITSFGLPIKVLTLGAYGDWFLSCGRAVRNESARWLSKVRLDPRRSADSLDNLQDKILKAGKYAAQAYLRDKLDMQRGPAELDSLVTEAKEQLTQMTKRWSTVPNLLHGATMAASGVAFTTGAYCWATGESISQLLSVLGF